MNRWVVVVGGMLIQFCLGVFYAWPVFSLKLCERGKYSFSVEQTQWIFFAEFATIACAMVASGILMSKVGPRRMTMASGSLLGAAYILGGLSNETFASQLMFIGIIGGLGTGLGYMVPISVVIKWFPDKKGLVTGITLAGFSLGTIIWPRLAGSWFDLLNTLSLFGMDGLGSVYLLFGGIILILVFLGSAGLKEPCRTRDPSGWMALGTNPVSFADRSSFEPLAMIRTPQFYMIWLIILFSALSGMVVADNVRTFGAFALQSSGLELRLANEAAGWAVASLLLLNVIGIVIWGSISDSIGRKMSILLMCITQGAVMLLFTRMVMGTDPKYLIFCACVIGFNMGGNFVLFPTITADYYGSKNVGVNYSLLFTAFAVAGVLEPQVAEHVRAGAVSSTGRFVWLWSFILAGCACMIAAGLAFFLRIPKERSPIRNRLHFPGE